MHALQTALGKGFRSALDLRALAPLWIATFVLGLFQTWPLWIIGGTALRRPFLGNFLGGGLDQLLDLTLQNPVALGTLGAWAGFQLFVLLIQRIIYAFCAGGMLNAYLSKARFGASALRFWLTFLGLDLILFPLILLEYIVIGAGFVAISPWLLLAIPVLAAMLGIVSEYARAIAAVRERLNPFVLFGQAFGFCARHFGGVLLLTILATIVLAGVLFGYLLVASALRGSWLLVVAQQLTIGALVWLKGLRLAWAAHYVEQHDRAQQGATAVPLLGLGYEQL